VGLFTDIKARKDIELFAKTLATQFAKRLPKEQSGDAKRVTVELQVAAGHAVGFQRSTKLGLYGRSQLANTFQWELIELGYDATFAKGLGHEIAVKLASSSGSAKVA
jgi:hypothetical protein